MVASEQLSGQVCAETFVEDRSVLARATPPPDKVVRYGDLAEHIADVRYARDTASQAPLIIFIHGGFWRPQFDRSHAGPLCAAVAEAGWTIASIEYRRIPGNSEATLADVGTAVANVPSLVERHNGSSIVVGHSAGGHLALWAAVKCTSSKLIGALALAPSADLQYGYEKGIGDHAVRAFLGGDPQNYRDVDPTKMPSPGIPTVIVHGVQDAIAPIAMAENYAACHPATRLVRIENCGHFAVIDPASAAWTRIIAELKLLQ